MNLKGGRWRKRHKRWSGAIKRKSRWQSLVSFLVLCQGFSCCARCPVSWVWGLPCFWLKDHDGGKQMEDYSWPNCLCPANTPPSAVRRSLRLCAPRQKLASTSAAIVSMWLMRSSLTFTFYRSGLCLPIPTYRFACHCRKNPSDIIMEHRTHKVSLNPLMSHINLLLHNQTCYLSPDLLIRIYCSLLLVRCVYCPAGQPNWDIQSDSESALTVRTHQHINSLLLIATVERCAWQCILLWVHL